MTSPITTSRHGHVLVITSNNPPVNALGHAVREGLVRGIEEADGDEHIKAVVIIGEGATFFAGADISEFGKPAAMAEPVLPTLVDMIEASDKPVVTPEKIANSVSLSTEEVTIASTNAIEITAPVFWSIVRAPAAIPRR